MTPNQYQSKLIRLFLIFFVFLAFASAERASRVTAGIFDDESGATYKEIWINHTEFTGGCGDHDAPNGTWYVEPARKTTASCLKFLDFTLPNDYNNATKIEIYLDIWRGHDELSVAFALNNGPNHRSTVGADWSRTPFIQEIPKNQFKEGTNTIQVWKESNAYHIHDIGFRLYYDSPNQLAGESAPSGQLLTVTADNGTFPSTGLPNQPLAIDGDQITLTAGNFSADAEFVEFYAFYDGYDEDADGITRDWHNRGRNNCHDGGIKSKCVPNVSTADLATGFYGTIDHVGTVRVNGNATVSMSWDVTQLPGQSDVRFKMRVLSNNRNARDAAGGVSSTFELRRSRAVTTFVIPNFVDDVLHADGTKPDLVTRFIDLPPDVATYDKAYMIGSYWKNPTISLNGSQTFRAFDASDDDWTLSVREINLNHLQPGRNQIDYIHPAEQTNYGEFIEKPGPMIVLKRTQPPGSDTTPPWASNPAPANGATNTDLRPRIAVQLYDSQSGVDEETVEMLVDGRDVSDDLAFQGDQFNYTIVYTPTHNLPRGKPITVIVSASDHAGNVMPLTTHTFTTQSGSGPSQLDSDDFNTCILETARWLSIPSPQGDSQLTLTGDQVSIFVPAGVEHDIRDGQNAAPRLLQPTDNGDFDVEIKFDSTLDGITDPAQGRASHGLWLGDSDDFIRYGLTLDGEGNPQLSLRIFVDEAAIDTHQKVISLPGGSLPSHLRVQRQGNHWDFFYAGDGTNWTSFTSFTYTLIVAEMGPYAANAGAQPPDYTALIDYFFDRSAPITPEDADALYLPVSVVGAGSVTKDQACGNPVQLTANAQPGWSFAGYSGAVNSSQPVANVTFARNDSVTATFTQEQYTLFTRQDGAGSGTISASPQQDTYLYGDLVELVAQSAPGSQFMGWHGAVSSTEPTVAITMTGHATVTATFAQVQYTLATLTAGTGGGFVAKVPDKPTYVYGDVVALTALPAPDSLFVGWQGDVNSASSSATITLTDNVTVTAIFDRARYFVTTAADGNGQGTVTLEPERGSYFHGDPVTLTALPAAGSLFGGWRGDIAGTNPQVTLTMTQDISTTATFVLPEYALNIALVGQGGVSKTPDMPTYTAGSVVALTANPASGWSFVGWEGAVAGITNPINLTINANAVVTATFTQGGFTIITQTVGSGLVLLNPLQAVYAEGDVVEVTAQPAPGWAFSGWQGALTGMQNPADLTVSGSHTLSATFVRAGHALALEQGEGGTIFASPQKNGYGDGEVVTLTAVAAPGWRFTGWRGDAQGSGATTTVVMNGDKQVGATFVREEYTLSVVTNPGGNVSLTPLQASYVYSDIVELTAVADPEWTFVGWQSSTGLTSGDNPLSLMMTTTQVITASFTQEPLSLTFEMEGDGEIQVNPRQSVYTAGDQVTLTAVPGAGWRFVQWESSAGFVDGQSPTSPTLTLTVASNATYRAIFEEVGFLHQALLPLVSSPQQTQ